jgi:hypothetical protein
MNLASVVVHGQTVPNIPIPIAYVIVLVIFLVVVVRLGQTAWHAAVAAFALGILAPTVAFPKQLGKMTELATNHSLAPWAYILTVGIFIFSLIMVIRDRRRGGGEVE